MSSTPNRETRRKLRQDLGIVKDTLARGNERLAHLLDVDARTIARNLRRRAMSPYLAGKWMAATGKARCLRAITKGARQGEGERLDGRQQKLQLGVGL